MSSFTSRYYKRRLIDSSNAAKGGNNKAKEDLLPLFGLSQGRPYEDIGTDNDDLSIF
tara:strand:+ start:324 stop:494 length:171 start_codon:yes stop_codon:yes gene_type:complete